MSNGDRRHGRSRSRTRSRSRSRSPPSSSKSSSRDVLEICWKPIREDGHNFDAWTHLLQCVENMDDMKPAREAFEMFLTKFPYCFGYWRKFAEMERRHKHYERCIEVYDKALSVIPLCVDLWISYLAFFKDHVKDSETKEKRIRQLYERAIGAAGLEFRSDKLWEEYIAWESSTENYQNVMQIYDRLLKVPLLLYSTHFERLQEFVNKCEPHEVLSQTEFDKLYSEIDEVLRGKGQEMFVIDETNEEKPTKDELTDDYDPTKVALKKKYNDEALEMFRFKILDKRRKVHLKTEQEVSKRWNYEEAIKRPYFHVKPLERAQLKNWRHYLDFEIDEGDKERIRILFERCLIACAMYEDIWIRYARYTETVDVEEARQVYKRACQVHLTKKPNPHLAWVAFEEKIGHFDYAKGILTSFDLDNPGLVLIQMRRLGLEMRHAIKQAASGDSSSDQVTSGDVTAGGGASSGPNFSELCKKYEMLILDTKSSKKMSSFYAIKYARFQAKVRKDTRLAEKILLDALARDTSNIQLHNQLINIVFSQEPFNLKDVVKALDRAMNAEGITDMDKLQFSQRKVELLEDLGEDIEEIQRHYESHLKMYKSLGFSSSKKRTPESKEDASSKKLKTEPVAMPTAVAPVVVHHHHAAPAYPANYYDYYYQQSGVAGYPAGATSGSAVVSSPYGTGRTYGYYASSSSSAHHPGGY